MIQFNTTLRKQPIFLFSLFLLSSSIAVAQTTELGFGGYFYKQSGMLISTYDPGSVGGFINERQDVKESNGIPGFCVVHYRPFYDPSETFSIGGQFGGHVYMFYQKQDDATNFAGQTLASGSSSGLFLGYQIPVSINLRLLNGSTEDSDEGFGLGFGLGYTAHGFIITNEKGFMLSPFLMGEIKYNKLGLRFDYLLKKYKSVYTTDTGDIPRLTTNFYTILVTVVL